MKKIEAYVSSEKPELIILTPTYGHQCNIDFVISLINTIQLMRLYNIPLSIEFCKNDSLVPRARNNLVAKAMAYRHCQTKNPVTHIMFIDSDIVWNPMDILKLLVSDKELIGGVYPKKKYHFEKLLGDPSILSKLLDQKNRSVLKNMKDVDYLKCKLVDCNLNYITENIQIVENICEVKHVATGFLMMKRETIDAMCAVYAYSKYEDDCGFLSQEEQPFAFALFDCDVEDGHYLSEDWLFCNRWRNMGNQVFVDVSINLCHVGNEYFNGSILASLL